ncbi:MAG: membrane protein insertion efficiency factor YidD [Candidatus Daviesbacteria bacterium]|nr:MAG: membrane protein insertion efficiency factor YidD [Candidatus Daviesbacteria bacterium]
MKTLFIKLISFYQIFLSFDQGILSYFAPGGACRYPVSCSQYSKQMIQKYGVAKGLWLTVQRLWRCR